MTQQSHFWAYTLRIPELKETHVPQCSLQHCLFIYLFIKFLFLLYITFQIIFCYGLLQDIDYSSLFFFFLCIYIFLILIFTLFYFTILYWFCHTLTWISHKCTWVPKHEPPSHLPPHIISLDHPHAPAPSILYPASNIDWRFVSCMIVYMFQCHSPKSSHPLPLP